MTYMCWVVEGTADVWLFIYLLHTSSEEFQGLQIVHYYATVS